MADAKHLQIPYGLSLRLSALSPTNFTLDQTTDQLEFIFQAEEAMTIARLGFRYGARTGTPPTYIVSLQGVDGSGNPDGTIKGGGSPASVTFTPPADTSIDGLWQWKTLANPYTCSQGEFLSIVVAYSSGTVDGSNNSSFTQVDGNDLSGGSGYARPYSIANNATVRTRSGSRPIFAYGAAATVYGNPILSVNTSGNITQSSTPDEWATRFVIPARWSGSYQVAGIMIKLSGNALPAAKTFKVQLYSGTTVLQTITVDTDLETGSGLHWIYFTENPLSALVPGVEYRIGFQPQDAAGNYTYQYATQTSNAEWMAYPLGVDWYLSTRTDLGAWTDDTASRLACALLLRDISAPAPGIIMASG